MLLSLAPELIRSILLYVEFFTLIECRVLNSYLLEVVSDLPQYKRLCLLCSSTVDLTKTVFGYSFLDGTNAEILAINFATAFWCQLSHQDSPVSFGAWSDVAKHLQSQKPFSNIVRHLAKDDEQSINDIEDRTYTVTAALRLLACSMTFDRSNTVVWGANVANIELDLTVMPDKKTVMRRLAIAKIIEEWPFQDPRYLSMAAECIIVSASRYRNIQAISSS